ncbi:MAG: IMP dehydrogenase [Spirochaetales bacterium]|jgi:IMP dehydrogenase|nr:IMP dehydrogenase [Spirochaetales bacterium]
MEIKETLSYDDVLLMPAYAELLPGEIDIRSRLCGDIYLNTPILSAAMDTVTEDRMAKFIALHGGAGVIHRNLSPDEQARQVGVVKRSRNWIIDKPHTVEENMTIRDVKRITAQYKISGLPVVDSQGKLSGIITNRDTRFCDNPDLKVSEVMTKDPIRAKKPVDISLARELFNRHKIEKIPVVDGENRIIGLITFKDLEKHEKYPQAVLDKAGRLVVGAAVSPQDYERRIPLLLENGVNFVVIDTAHGDSAPVVKAIGDIKKRWDILVVGGNVATPEGTKRMIDAGSDAVKVGIGPGSICTTRVVSGAGAPQFSAVLWCAEEADKYNIPVIADGGVKFSGDITKAIAAGAGTVMLGGLLAGLEESPGQAIIYDGRMFKQYRGMGALGAIQEGGGDRYQMNPGEGLVPEGIEGRVPYKGEVRSFLHQLSAGLRKGMFYCGCRNIEELRRYRKFLRITSAGLIESHPHDVVITQEAPNYSPQ